MAPTTSLVFPVKAKPFLDNSNIRLMGAISGTSKKSGPKKSAGQWTTVSLTVPTQSIGKSLMWEIGANQNKFSLLKIR